MEIKCRNIAGNDDADAQYQLYFDCRDRGENVECVKWLRRAAQNGLPEAEYELGFVYEDETNRFILHRLMLDCIS